MFLTLCIVSIYTCIQLNENTSRVTWPFSEGVTSIPILGFDWVISESSFDKSFWTTQTAFPRSVLLHLYVHTVCVHVHVQCIQWPREMWFLYSYVHVYGCSPIHFSSSFPLGARNSSWSLEFRHSLWPHLSLC